MAAVDDAVRVIEMVCGAALVSCVDEGTMHVICVEPPQVSVTRSENPALAISVAVSVVLVPAFIATLELLNVPLKSAM
jgi:hypothetical protein